MKRPCFQEYQMPAEWSWDSCHKQQALPEVPWDCSALLAAELFAAWSQHVRSQTCYEVLPVLLWEAEAQSPLCSTQTSPYCDCKLKSWSQVSLSRVELPLVQAKPFSNASVPKGLLENTTANACKNRKILNHQKSLGFEWLFLALSFLPWTPLCSQGKQQRGLTNGSVLTASADLQFCLQTLLQGIVMERLPSAWREKEWEYLSGYGGCSRRTWWGRSALEQPVLAAPRQTGQWECSTAGRNSQSRNKQYRTSLASQGLRLFSIPPRGPHSSSSLLLCSCLFALFCHFYVLFFFSLAHLSLSIVVLHSSSQTFSCLCFFFCPFLLFFFFGVCFVCVFFF